MELIIDIIMLAMAFWAGKHYAQVRFLFNISKNPEKFITMLEQIKAINANEELGIPEDVIEVRIEQDNNMVYAYEKVSGQFLAQAQNLHQAMIEASKRFPSKKFWHPEMKEDSQTA